MVHAGADPEPDAVEAPVSPRWQGGTLTRLRDGRWLLASTEHPAKHTYASFLWSPKTRRWKATGDLRMPRYQHQATLLADGRVLVTGGYHVAV